MNKATKKAVSLILKDIQNNAISKEHRKAELNLKCPECKFRLLEAYLLWYKDLVEFDEKNNS